MEVTHRIAADHLDGSDQGAAAGDEQRSAGVASIGGDVAGGNRATADVTDTRSMNCVWFECPEPPNPDTLPLKALVWPGVSAISSPPLPLDRNLTFSPLDPAMSTMPSPIRATPPLTTAPLAISTRLPAALANSVPPLVTVPLTIAVPPFVSMIAAAPIVPLFSVRCCRRFRSERGGRNSDAAERIMLSTVVISPPAELFNVPP